MGAFPFFKKHRCIEFPHQCGNILLKQRDHNQFLFLVDSSFVRSLYLTPPPIPVKIAVCPLTYA